MPTDSIEALTALYLDTLGRARRRAHEDMKPAMEMLWLRILENLAAYSRGELEEAELRAILECAPIIDALVAAPGDEAGEMDWEEDYLAELLDP